MRRWRGIRNIGKDFRLIVICFLVIFSTIQTYFLTEQIIAQKSVDNQQKELVIQDPQAVLNPVGAWDENYGYSEDVYVLDDRAYITGEGMVIVDISDPENPFFLGQYVEEDNLMTQGIYVVGNVAFLVGRCGLKIINVSNPLNPTLISSYSELYESYIDISIQGNYAYLLKYSDSFDIIDISDLANPTVVSQLIVSHGTSNEGIFVKDGVAYIALDFEGLEIVNVSNPSIPVLISENEEYYCNDVFVQDNLAYIVGSEGLVILNVSDLVHPVNLSKVDISYAKGITYDDDFVYIANYEEGMTIVNVTDPHNATISGSCQSNIDGLAIAKKENHVFMVTNPTGMKIIDVSNSSQPQQAAAFDCGGFGESVIVRNSVAFLANGYDGLVILDVNNVANPSILSKVEFGKAHDSDFQVMRAHDIYLYENYAFVLLEWNEACSWFNRFAVINITDLSNPQIICQFGRRLWINDAIFDNTMLYVGSYGNLDIYNLENITAPELLVTYNESFSRCNSLRKQGDILYIGTSDALLICDASNPLSLTILSSEYEDRIPLEIELGNDRMYILFVSPGLEDKFTISIFDIEDIESPVLIGELNFNYSYNAYLTVYNSTIFVSSDDNLLVFQETLDQKVELIDEFQGAHYFYKISIEENHLYVAASYDGLLIFEIVIPTSSNEISIKYIPIGVSVIIAIFIYKWRRKKRFGK